MDKNFIAYFAGYIDGDGHFRFRSYLQEGYVCHHCKIMITSTDEAPFVYFKENIGGTYYKKVKTKEKWKDEFIYTLHVGKEKFKEIETLESFLVEKLDQFKLIRKFIFGDKIKKEKVIQTSKKLRNSNFVDKDSFESIKQVKNSVVPRDEDFIYLAGYIDSECCLTVTKKTLKTTNSLSFSCHLRSGVTKTPCTKFLFERFGGCISYKIPKKHSSSIEWEITDKTLEPILKKIYPYLIIKKEQCKLLIEMRDTYKDKLFPRDRNFYSYYAHVTPVREQIFNSLKCLNKRGV